MEIVDCARRDATKDRFAFCEKAIYEDAFEAHSIGMF